MRTAIAALAAVTILALLLDRCRRSPDLGGWVGDCPYEPPAEVQVDCYLDELWYSLFERSVA